MNKEQQELLDEAYKNYKKHNDDTLGRSNHWTITHEEFINKCKNDKDFSEKWGLKIEERELSLEERIILTGYDYENRGGVGWNMLKESVDLDNSIHRKLITITYNDKTIESYE
jgi:hypothetical protein